ncbi:hypothetical protein [Mycobacterium decipiens]|nr:hypothetical protein [Mycobacterium decipiens]
MGWRPSLAAAASMAAVAGPYVTAAVNSGFANVGQHLSGLLFTGSGP